MEEFNSDNYRNYKFVGQTFDSFSVLSLDELTSTGIFTCKCNKCGKLFKMSGSSIYRHRKDPSGECSHNRNSKAKDLAKRQFDGFDIIEKTDKRYHGYVVWKCKCKYCGKIFEVPYVNIERKSCGCLSNKYRDIFKESNTATGIIKTSSMTYDISGDYGIGYTRSGQKFLFDLEDYEKISKYSWHVSGKQLKSGGHRHGNTGYLIVSYIFNIDNPMTIKRIIYKNGDNFDYRKSNIEILYRNAK